MDRGTMDGFVGSRASGFDYLVIDGIPVPCDNGPTVRAPVVGAYCCLCQKTRGNLSTIE
jgi:hypothetical protein